MQTIFIVNTYEPHSFGLDVPEPVVREAYIMKPDLSPIVGWETGRPSVPQFMDMNLHGVRAASLPRVVLLQNDLSDPMNPHGLLIAYAEKFVKPVCSDFDTFTVGSKGMKYEALPDVRQACSLPYPLAASAAGPGRSCQHAHVPSRTPPAESECYCVGRLPAGTSGDCALGARPD